MISQVSALECAVSRTRDWVARLPTAARRGHGPARHHTLVHNMQAHRQCAVLNRCLLVYSFSFLLPFSGAPRSSTLRRRRPWAFEPAGFVSGHRDQLGALTILGWPGWTVSVRLFKVSFARCENNILEDARCDNMRFFVRPTKNGKELTRRLPLIAAAKGST